MSSACANPSADSMPNRAPRQQRARHCAHYRAIGPLTACQKWRAPCPGTPAAGRPGPPGWRGAAALECQEGAVRRWLHAERWARGSIGRTAARRPGCGMPLLGCQPSRGIAVPQERGKGGTHLHVRHHAVGHTLPVAPCKLRWAMANTVSRRQGSLLQTKAPTSSCRCKAGRQRCWARGQVPQRRCT